MSTDNHTSRRWRPTIFDVGLIEFRSELGCKSWFGSQGLTPPVIPRTARCFVCGKHAIERGFSQCPECRHRMLNTTYEVGCLSSPEEFELSEINGGFSGYSRPLTVGYRHGREPVRSDILYEGEE